MHIKAHHHGRVRMPFVAITTMTSDFLMPCSKRVRKSTRSVLSADAAKEGDSHVRQKQPYMAKGMRAPRYAGTPHIILAISRTYRASEPASTL